MEVLRCPEHDRDELMHPLSASQDTWVKFVVETAKLGYGRLPGSNEELFEMLKTLSPLFTNRVISRKSEVTELQAIDAIIDAAATISELESASSRENIACAVKVIDRIVTSGIMDEEVNSASLAQEDVLKRISDHERTAARACLEVERLYPCEPVSTETSRTEENEEEGADETDQMDDVTEDLAFVMNAVSEVKSMCDRMETDTNVILEQPAEDLSGLDVQQFTDRTRLVETAMDTLNAVNHLRDAWNDMN